MGKETKQLSTEQLTRLEKYLSVETNKDGMTIKGIHFVSFLFRIIEFVVVRDKLFLNSNVFHLLLKLLSFYFY